MLTLPTSWDFVTPPSLEFPLTHWLLLLCLLCQLSTLSLAMECPCTSSLGPECLFFFTSVLFPFDSSSCMVPSFNSIYVPMTPNLCGDPKHASELQTMYVTVCWTSHPECLTGFSNSTWSLPCRPWPFRLSVFHIFTPSLNLPPSSVALDVLQVSKLYLLSSIPTVPAILIFYDWNPERLSDCFPYFHKCFPGSTYPV